MALRLGGDRLHLEGVKLAVLGAGRSGMAVARAAGERGAKVAVYDANDREDLQLVRDEGIEVIAPFNGSFSRSSTDVVVTSPGVDSRSELLRDAVRSEISVVGEIEFAFWISQAPIVAITGTNGKSTTTLMTWLLLKESEEGEVFLCGNIYGSGYPEMPLTEAAAKAKKGDLLVAEISSFQLEWIQDFHPKAAAITNITPDHLNRYDSFEAYAATKHKIYKNMGPEDTYVWHTADSSTSPGTHPHFQILGTNYDTSAIYAPNGAILPLEQLTFNEQHNFANAAMAVNLAYAASATLRRKAPHSVGTTLLRGLQSFSGLAHRMERAGSRGGVELINNSMCTNPGAVIASSKSVGKHLHLLMGGMTKDLDFSPLSLYLKESGNKAYLYGQDGNQINLVLGGSFPVFRTMAEAFHAAISNVKAGEAVMLAPGCASMDQYTDFRERGEEFRQLAKEWLEHESVTN